MDKKEKFNKVYSNLPLNLRDETVLVITANGHNEPISWRVAKLEVDADTKLSGIILEKLEILKFI